MTLPAVPDYFYWTNESWGPALRCRPLEAVAAHLFTSRQLELPSPAAWKLLAPLVDVPADRFLTLNQIHGRDVVTIRRGIADTAAALTAAGPDNGPRRMRSSRMHRTSRLSCVPPTVCRC